MHHDVLRLRRILQERICPICNGPFSMQDGGWWSCEGCRTGGDKVAFLAHITGCTIKQAKDRLDERGRLPSPDSKRARQIAIARTGKLEVVARDYGLALTETAGAWPVRWGGRNFVTRCPRCRGPLFIHIGPTLQVWTCSQCRAGYLREESATFADGDAIALVRFLSRSTFDRAVWYLGGGGPRP